MKKRVSPFQERRVVGVNVPIASFFRRSYVQWNVVSQLTQRPHDASRSRTYSIGGRGGDEKLAPKRGRSKKSFVAVRISVREKYEEMEIER